VVTHEVDGLLTKNSTEALAEAIERLLTEEGLLTRFREATLEKSASFDILIHARRLVEVYKQAIQDKREHQYVKVSKRHKLL
jgi:glycosyltransferase involved in cell wall biosynthesis